MRMRVKGVKGVLNVMREERRIPLFWRLTGISSLLSLLSPLPLCSPLSVPSLTTYKGISCCERLLCGLPITLVLSVNVTYSLHSIHTTTSRFIVVHSKVETVETRREGEYNDENARRRRRFYENLYQIFTVTLRKMKLFTYSIHHTAETWHRICLHTVTCAFVFTI